MVGSLWKAFALSGLGLVFLNLRMFVFIFYFFPFWITGEVTQVTTSGAKAREYCQSR